VKKLHLPARWTTALDDGALMAIADNAGFSMVRMILCFRNDTDTQPGLLPAYREQGAAVSAAQPDACSVGRLLLLQRHLCGEQDVNTAFKLEH